MRIFHMLILSLLFCLQVCATTYSQQSESECRRRFVLDEPLEERDERFPIQNALNLWLETQEVKPKTEAWLYDCKRGGLIYYNCISALATIYIFPIANDSQCTFVELNERDLPAIGVDIRFLDGMYKSIFGEGFYGSEDLIPFKLQAVRVWTIEDLKAKGIDIPKVW